MGRIELFPTASGSMMTASPTLPQPGLALPSGRPPRCLVFDSGVGGLSVLKEIQTLLPELDITYVADDAGFPYGAWMEHKLVDHVGALMGDLIATHKPDLVVIACNTASTLVLPSLRQRFDTPFVGTVPAIKTAASVTRSRVVSVLATPGTVKRDYTRALIDTYASHLDIALVGAQSLATLAEAFMRGETISDQAVKAEIRPCFRDIRGRKTDTIVLGCTHYPFLIDTFKRVAPWTVTWIDPAPAIARRVAALLGREARGSEARPATMPAAVPAKPGRAVFTTGATPDALISTLSKFALTA